MTFQMWDEFNWSSNNGKTAELLAKRNNLNLIIVHSSKISI